MLATSRTFEANARAGLGNPILQRALSLMRSGFPERRRLAVERLPEFEALRDIGKSIKDHTLDDQARAPRTGRQAGPACGMVSGARLKIEQLAIA
jgi:hypothetical protein